MQADALFEEMLQVSNAVVSFKMITSYIGLGLMFLCVFGFSVIRLYQMVKLKKIDFLQQPSLTLVALEKAYEFQQFVSNKVSMLYFVLS